ncbi:BaiN/RdsA family NAD(P)/FAD-dependent oxidoreductase [Aquimarina rhabdastrellae]
MRYDIIIIGGGAAGFFTAINAATKNTDLRIAILERGKEVLSKVRISGGGRCNVTHGEFIPNELAKNYPRGERELKGPFHTFMTGDTMEWFEQRGVALKIEEDGRVFPESDSSSSIINCFLNEANKLGIEILTNHSVKSIKKESNDWEIATNQDVFEAEKIMVATGSNPKIWKLLEDLGHTIVDPVPSLFTFNCDDKRIKELPGVVANAAVKIQSDKLKSEGPLLITHWGMSGPAILKLSAWGARALEARQYKFEIKVNWLKDYATDEAVDLIDELKYTHKKQQIGKYAQFNLPKRLWRSLVEAAEISLDARWADLPKKKIQQLAVELTQSVFKIDGKSTFKEEFVTAGGVNLKEVNFKTFESKKQTNLYLAGEVLNIDAITGGFNFQNAWTGAYIASQAMTT